jgi:hypothetical protein
MSYWVIHKKGTDLFLPDMFGRSRGWSWTEPHARRPRLLGTEKTANRVLKEWCRGVRYGAGKKYGPNPTTIAPQAGRNIADFEVVEVAITPVVKHDDHCRGCGCHI